MGVDPWLLGRVDAACDSTREPPLRARDEVESLLDAWYRLLGLDAPRAVLWAADPSEVGPLVAAVREAAQALGGDGLSIVDASLAAGEGATAPSDAVVAQIVEAVTASATAWSGPTVRAMNEGAARALRGELVEAVGEEALVELAQRAFRRAGSMRADRILLVANLLGWYRADARSEWLRPMSLRWFGPEMIDALAESGVAAAVRWRSWGSLVRSVLSVWAFHGVAVICPPPCTSSLDAQGRPHGEDGPALRWDTGWELHAWHGTLVPRSIIDAPWPAASIMRIRNAEVRRCAIERLGWDRVVADLKLRRIGTDVPDPGNPGHTLALYEIPAGILHELPSHVLLCTNATIERDGTRRRYGLEVPAWIADPIEAAAWTFDLEPHDYLTLTAAT